MGYELYRMIRDGAPPSWTPPMRLLAETIADDARDPSQGSPDDGGWPWSAIQVHGHHDGDGDWHDGLAERTGMSGRTISRALGELAGSGYEMREIIGRGVDGHPVFTARGRAMRFRVPPLPPRKPPERSPDMASEAAERSPDMASERSPETTAGRAERSPKTAEPSPKKTRTVAKSGDPSSPDLPQIFPNPDGPVVNSNLEGVRDRQGDDDFETHRRQEQDRLTAWLRDHPEADQ